MLARIKARLAARVVAWLLPEIERQLAAHPARVADRAWQKRREQLMRSSLPLTEALKLPNPQ